MGCGTSVLQQFDNTAVNEYVQQHPNQCRHAMYLTRRAAMHGESAFYIGDDWEGMTDVQRCLFMLANAGVYHYEDGFIEWLETSPEYEAFAQAESDAEDAFHFAYVRFVDALNDGMDCHSEPWVYSQDLVFEFGEHLPPSHVVNAEGGFLTFSIV